MLNLLNFVMNVMLFHTFAVLFKLKLKALQNGPNLHKQICFYLHVIKTLTKSIPYRFLSHQMGIASFSFIL